MNFCRFYNKTRMWVSKNLLDLSNSEDYSPVVEINIFVGTLVLIVVVLLAILFTVVVGFPIYIIETIRQKTMSRCDLEEK